MKKSLVLLPALLIVIFAILSVIDRSDYIVEKKIWKIQQQFAVQAKYGILSKEESENLAAMYRDLIRQYPKSGLLAQIYMQIGQVYTVSKDFEIARTSYSKVLEQIPRQQNLCSEALLGIGLIYEEEKKDAQALKTYQQIVKNYPLTDIGLSMPIYIANYYIRLNQDAEMENAFKEAERFYKKVAYDYPDSSEGFHALRFLAATYLVQKKWDGAVKAIEKTLLDYSRSPYLDWKTAGSMVYTINVVSVEKLKVIDPPIAFYRMYIEKRPGEALNTFLKKVIISLQDLKSGKKVPVIQKI